MHMSDVLLSPAVGATFWAGTVGAITYSSRKIRENLDDRMIPLMGVLGAFVFAGQMINFTIPGTGSSGHLGGGMLLSIMLGPYAAFLVIASVLTVQSLFFADGGILALGCNIWNLGIYPCLVAYPLIYRPLTRGKHSPKRITAASAVSVIVALQLGALSVVLQTVLSGRSELPFGTFLLMMQPIHLAIGFVEGMITAAVIRYVRSVRPEVLEGPGTTPSPTPGVSVGKLVSGFLVLALVAGGALSWFASSFPDGLEWSIEKVYGKPELTESDTWLVKSLGQIQEKTAFLPDYTFKGDKSGPGAGEESTWPAVDRGRSLSGVLGALMVLGIVVIIGAVIRFTRKKREVS